jgi:hypothetical protein
MEAGRDFWKNLFPAGKPIASNNFPILCEGPPSAPARHRID